MAPATDFVIGAGASCTDGPCGTLTRVVIDPIAETVTHLVIAPHGLDGPGRLVPVTLVDDGKDGLAVRCSLAEFGKLDPAEETHFLPGPAGYPAYGPGQVLAWPYYGLGGMGMGMGAEFGPGEPVTYETVPAGEVSVRRGDQVHATDGAIGRVQGLVIDPRSHHVTHVLLQEGHLWGRRDVAIPVSAVTGTDSGIRLNLTKKEVEDLPPVDLHRDQG
jgi:hypothetical protein